MPFTSGLMSLVTMSVAVEPAAEQQRKSSLARWGRPALGLLLPLGLALGWELAVRAGLSNEQLAAFHASHLADPVSERPTQPVTRTMELGDVAIIDKCRSAKNAGKFNGLWRGSTSGYASSLTLTWR